MAEDGIMELRELRYFVALAEERHFTRAAARCFITQPAFSRAIAKLEREAGTPLLDRSAATFTPTNDGSDLLKWAHELLTRADAGWRTPPLVDDRTLFTLGVCVGAGARLLPHLLNVFTARCPDVRLAVREVDTVEQVEGLRTGRVDACLSYLPQDQPGIERHVMASEPRVALLSAHDERAASPTLTVAEVIDSWYGPADPREPSGWDEFFTLSDIRGDRGRRQSHAFVADAYQQCHQIAAGQTVVVAHSFAATASLAGLVAVPVVDATPAPLTLAASDGGQDEPVDILQATLSDLVDVA